jgi:hypothetical protein
MCKLVIKEFDPSQYFFNNTEKQLEKKVQMKEVLKAIRKEINEIAQVKSTV